jgi:glycosyltransferase involved in cell wall biosynthesis
VASKGKIAWSLGPVLSGMTTFYQVVGRGLRQAGWEVTGFVSGSSDAREIDRRFADDYCEVLVPGSSDVCLNARELARRVVDRKYDLVYCTGHLFSIACAPALPNQVRLATHCVVNTNRGYALAAANLDRVSVVVVETPRQQQDMIRDWKVDPNKCKLVSGGIEIENFSPGTVRDWAGSLRLVFMGRVDEDQKAVMMLPKIAGQLTSLGLDYHLDILGDGPDRARLEDAFAQTGLHARVSFHGTLRREGALPILQRAHLFLLPSRYEGVPWALLEAMACGCVPIVSLINGTTDYVVENGLAGLLCTVGKVSEFVAAIRSMEFDRERMAALSAAAVQTVRNRFTVERVVRDHDDLLQGLLAQDSPAYTPIPLSEIRMHDLPGSTWRRFLPQPVKNYARTWMERFHRSV